MNSAIDNLLAALDRAFKDRPKVGGFPFLAEVLRTAGVTQNIWHLPSCQSLYLTAKGPVVIQGAPLVNGPADVPPFDRESLIRAIRKDQRGESTFPEFLKASWDAGCVSYTVDFEKRTVTYYGWQGESYLEEYPAVSISV